MFVPDSEIGAMQDNIRQQCVDALEKLKPEIQVHNSCGAGCSRLDVCTIAARAWRGLTRRSLTSFFAGLFASANLQQSRSGSLMTGTHHFVLAEPA